MPLAEKKFLVSPESPEVGQRADLIVQNLCGLSRSQVRGLFDHGCVQVNGARCVQPGQILASGDQVRLKYDPRQRYHPTNKPRRNLGFEVVFEDKHLIVVGKPAELLTVPTLRGETNTLVNKVTEYVKHVGGGRGAFTCHRLDRGVSGLLVLAKTLEISQRIRDQFALHKPEREYAAIVAGVMERKQGVFESLLATDKDLNRFSTDDAEIGQIAITHYRVVQPLADCTFVQVWLETGRRNQIRVHFSEAGHPVLGDPRYQPTIASHRRWPHERIALHARLLGFEHPITGERLRFESALPMELDRFLSGGR